MSKLIEVSCICFPDGSNYWHPSDREHTEKAIDLWKSKNLEFDNRCTMGMVQIWMPEDKYLAMPAFNGFVVKL